MDDINAQLLAVQSSLITSQSSLTTQSSLIPQSSLTMAQASLTSQSGLTSRSSVEPQLSSQESGCPTMQLQSTSDTFYTDMLNNDAMVLLDNPLVQVSTYNSTVSPLRPSQHRAREDPKTPTRKRRIREQNMVGQFVEQLSLTVGHQARLEEFTAMDVRCMLISIQAQLLKNSEDLAVKESEDFRKSSFFKNNIVPKLKSVMMSTSLCAYVTKLADFILTDMSVHHTAWGIPRSIFNDTTTCKAFKDSVRKVLIDWRSKAREKIEDSRIKGIPIWKLTESIAHENFVVEKKHWVRFAAIRRVVKIHKENVAKEKTKEKEFWRSVDIFFVDLRAKIESNPKAIQQAMYDGLMNTLYEQDLKEFPGDDQCRRPSPSAPRAITPQWQSDMERMVRDFHFDDAILRGDDSESITTESTHDTDD